MSDLHDTEDGDESFDSSDLYDSISDENEQKMGQVVNYVVNGGGLGRLRVADTLVNYVITGDQQYHIYDHFFFANNDADRIQDYAVGIPLPPPRRRQQHHQQMAQIHLAQSHTIGDGSFDSSDLYDSLPDEEDT